MEPIIAPVSVELLKAELTPAKKLRDTNKSKNEIYIINHHDSPNVMREIARLREVTFRDAGGGSGLEIDIDEFDTMENPYQQLIVWDPEAEKILGGYRYILGSDIKLDENGQPARKTSHSLNPVPCIVYDPESKGEYKSELREGLGISSLAATCIELLGYQAPANYDPSVLQK
jgi:hypothetical protein